MRLMSQTIRWMMLGTILNFFLLATGGADVPTLKTEKIKYIGVEALVDSMDNSVYDIDADGQKIYIPNYRKNNVLIFDSNFKDAGTINNVPYAHGIKVDSNGFIYVATYNNHRVLKFDKDLKEVVNWDQELVRDQKIKRPISVTVDKNNNVYVADYDLEEIIKVSPDGHYLGRMEVDLLKVPEKGQPPAKEPFLPHGITTDGEKYLYTVDRGMHKAVRVFSLDGKYIKAFDAAPGPLEPLAVRFLSKNLLLVPNYSGSQLCLYNTDGKFLESLGSAGTEAGQFKSVTNLVSAGPGLIYTVEQNTNRIQKINLQDIVAKFDK